jgi:hypothetical protein
MALAFSLTDRLGFAMANIFLNDKTTCLSYFKIRLCLFLLPSYYFNAVSATPMLTFLPSNFMLPTQPQHLVVLILWFYTTFYENGNCVWQFFSFEIITNITNTYEKLRMKIK